MLDRLARTCFRRRWFVLVAWIVALIALNAVASSIGNAYHSSLQLPSSESREVQTMLQKANPYRGGSNAQIVFGGKEGVNDPKVRDAMEDLFAKVDAIKDINVTSPYSPEGAGQVSRRAPVAFAELQVRDLEFNQVL